MLIVALFYFATGQQSASNKLKSMKSSATQKLHLAVHKHKKPKRDKAGVILSESIKRLQESQPKLSRREKFMTYYLPLIYCLLTVLLYIVVGSWIFIALEHGEQDLTYMDSLYWAVVTTNTVCSMQPLIATIVGSPYHDSACQCGTYKDNFLFFFLARWSRTLISLADCEGQEFRRLSFGPRAVTSHPSSEFVEYFSALHTRSIITWPSFAFICIQIFVSP